MFKEYRGLRRELYILFIGRIVTNMGSMIGPILTLVLNQKLGMSASDIANYMLVISLLGIPINLFGGKLADRFNKRNIIVVCDIISVVAYLLCGILPLTNITIILLALASLLQLAESPSYEALVADFTSSKDRERAYSLSYLGANLGLVLSPSIGGLLFKNYLWLAFIISGVSILLSTILIFFLIKDVSRTKDESDSIYESDIAQDISAVKYLKGNRVILLFLLITAIGNGVYNQFNYLMPLDLGNIFGDDGAKLYGFVTSLNCIIVFLFTAFMTRKFKRTGAGNKILIGEILIIFSYLLFVFTMKIRFSSYIVITIFTFGEIFNTLGSSPFLTKRIPASHRGRIASIETVFCSIFTAIVEKVVGIVYDLSGSTVSWIIVLVLGLVEIGIIVVMISLDKKDYPELQ